LRASTRVRFASLSLATDLSGRYFAVWLLSCRRYSFLEIHSSALLMSGRAAERLRLMDLHFSSMVE
jgi:hypothetical protein